MCINPEDPSEHNSSFVQILQELALKLCVCVKILILDNYLEDFWNKMHMWSTFYYGVIDNLDNNHGEYLLQMKKSTMCEGTTTMEPRHVWKFKSMMTCIICYGGIEEKACCDFFCN